MCALVASLADNLRWIRREERDTFTCVLALEMGIRVPHCSENILHEVQVLRRGASWGKEVSTKRKYVASFHDTRRLHAELYVAAAEECRYRALHSKAVNSQFDFRMEI